MRMRKPENVDDFIKMQSSAPKNSKNHWNQFIYARKRLELMQTKIIEIERIVDDMSRFARDVHVGVAFVPVTEWPP